MGRVKKTSVETRRELSKHDVYTTYHTNDKYKDPVVAVVVSKNKDEGYSVAFHYPIMEFKKFNRKLYILLCTIYREYSGNKSKPDSINYRIYSGRGILGLEDTK